MDPLIFNIRGEIGCDDSLLSPCSTFHISERMWQELAVNIAGEPTLIPCSAAILAQRCREGYAAVVIHCEHIISYIALAPIVKRTPGTHSWAAVLNKIETDPIELPATDIYEFTSSWTDPAWRRKHISIALRPPLIERHLPTNNLGLSGMLGLASPILVRLGWQILAWDAVPFVNSLIGIPSSEFPDQAVRGWQAPTELRPYQGPHISLDDSSHRWDRYYYCWVSNEALAIQLNKTLDTLLRGDLVRWRAAIIAAYSGPETSHQIAFLP